MVFDVRPGAVAAAAAATATAPSSCLAHVYRHEMAYSAAELGFVGAIQAAVESYEGKCMQHEHLLGVAERVWRKHGYGQVNTKWGPLQPTWHGMAVIATEQSWAATEAYSMSCWDYRLEGYAMGQGDGGGYEMGQGEVGADIKQDVGSDVAASYDLAQGQDLATNPDKQAPPCKFIPNADDWAGLRLRAMKDNHNERERRRKMRRQADKEAEAMVQQAEEEGYTVYTTSAAGPSSSSSSSAVCMSSEAAPSSRLGATPKGRAQPPQQC